MCDRSPRGSEKRDAHVKCLVTGGAGFIGSHLCEELLRRGHEVDALDDLSSGAAANVAHLLHDGRFRFAVGTLEEGAALADRVAACDVVFHLAAVVGLRRVLQSTLETFRTNVDGTHALLTFAGMGCKPVLLASSSEVYGKSTKVPFEEESDLHFGPPTATRWSYACSKLVGELLAMGHARERGVPAIVARVFNTAGPRQHGRYGMVVPTFVRQALAGSAITVFGDGTQRRSFTHVHETARALADLIAHASASPAIVNVGNDEEISIQTLAERVRRITGSSSPIVHVPYREAYGAGYEDVARRVPSLVRLESLVGWRPRLGIDRIVTDLLEAQRRTEC